MKKFAWVLVFVWLGGASGAFAQTPNTPTATPTNTPTAGPLSTSAPRRQGVSVDLTLLAAATPMAGPVVDVHGFSSGTVQLVVPSPCTSFTVKVMTTSIGSGTVPWVTSATYTASEVGAGVTKSFAVTPWPFGWLQVDNTASNTCTPIRVVGTFR